MHQIGNNYTFHIGSVEWLQRIRGVVVLHDFYLTNLFLGWCRQPGAAKGVEANTLQHWYGNDAPDRMAQAEAGGRFLEDTADWAPMTEWLCARSLGVLTHSSWGLDRVHQSTIGPVKPWLGCRTPQFRHVRAGRGHATRNRRNSTC